MMVDSKSERGRLQWIEKVNDYKNKNLLES